MNTQKKGARIERKFANLIKHIFPDVRRSGFLQAFTGGIDLQNTGCFDFEVKGGKSYKSKMIRDIITQVQLEGKKENYKIAAMFPEREDPYIIMPLTDFLQILQLMKAEKMI